MCSSRVSSSSSSCLLAGKNECASGFSFSNLKILTTENQIKTQPAEICQLKRREQNQFSNLLLVVPGTRRRINIITSKQNIIVYHLLVYKLLRNAKKRR